MTEPRGPQVAGENAADRLMRQVAYEYRGFERHDPPPTPAQVAVVLHALADHTAIMAALRWRREAGEPWPDALSMGRWFHDTADQIEHAE